MALPGDTTSCTVSFGAYTDAEGLAALASSGGKLTTVAADTGKPINVTHVATGQVILPKAVDITIGSDGTGSVGPIPHTDNPGLSPVGFAYRVEWDIASNRPSPRNKTFALPQAIGATADFDLLDVAEAVPGVLVPIGEGPQGDPGLTAYEVAVAEGFVGTEAAWLASLKGEQGDAGVADDASVAALVPGPGATATALRAALGAPGRDVALPSGARITPLPGALYNKERQNVVPFGMDAVTTVDGVQYAVWINQDRNPIIGKRTVPNGEWATFDLSTIPGNPLGAPTVDDGHNNYVVAVDSAGYLHVSGNLHGTPLRYVRSTARGSITAWEAPGMVGTEEAAVTYPQFVVLPSSELLFFYRDGGSVNGIVRLNAYNAATKTWTRRVTVLDGTVTATSYNPYINRPAVAPDGTIHLFVVWRPDGAAGNENTISHLKSADAGATWTTQAGAPLTLPVTRDTAPTAATITAPVNQQGADVDASGIPHAAFWGTSGFGVALRHVYWTGSAWQTDNVVTLPAGNQYKMARASIFCRGTDTYVMYSTDQNFAARSVRIKSVSTADPHVDFPLIEANLGALEPNFDRRALRDRDELVLLVTNGQSEDGTGNLPKHLRAWGGILTFPLTSLRVAAGLSDGKNGELGAVLDRPAWQPAPTLTANNGGPTLSFIGAGGSARVPAWRLDQAIFEGVSGLVSLPSWWTSVHVDLWWSNVDVGVGDVVWRADTGTVTSGAAVPATTSALLAPVTAPATNVIKTSRLLTDFAPPAAGMLSLGVTRMATDAADTLPNDAAVVGFMVSRAA